MKIEVYQNINENCFYIWAFKLIGLTLCPLTKCLAKKLGDNLFLETPEIITKVPDDIAALAIQEVTEKIIVL